MFQQFLATSAQRLAHRLFFLLNRSNEQAYIDTPLQQEQTHETKLKCPVLSKKTTNS